MKQHFIPRCYLKRFSDNNKSIFAYDKTTSKIYNASLMSVCCDDDIYTLSDEYVKNTREETGGNINNLSIEKDYFAKEVERHYSKLLNQIDEIKGEWVSGKNYYQLNFYENKELAFLIATDCVRQLYQH